jgi:hypothetical protein
MFSFQTVSGQRQVVDLTDVQDSRGLRISDGRVNLNGTDVNAPVVFQANRRRTSSSRATRTTSSRPT